MTKLKPKCTTCQIRNISLLKNCSTEVLEEISEQKICMHFQKGERLMTEGENAKGFYCIRSGVAKAEVQKNGKSLIMRLHGKGSIVGQRVTGEKDKEPITLTAVENTQACYVPADKFVEMTNNHPSLKTEIMKSLASEIQNAEKQVLSMVYNTVRERVAAVLLHIAEIYHYHQDGCSIHVHLDRQDIADLAGTTKEQVSLALAELRNAKLINFKAKHFKYFDLEGLRKMAEA